MKCPCKNCLIIPICKNRHTSNPYNIIIAIEHCSLLKNFLKVTKTCSPTIEFWSDLEKEELDERLKELTKHLPTKNIHAY